MFKQVDYDTANLNYESGKWVRIGDSPQNCWSVNVRHNEGMTLMDIVNRYRQYYDTPIKYYV